MVSGQRGGLTRNMTKVHIPASQRQKVDVLLLDAQNRQSVASMRAMARAGLRVGAVVCEADAWWAPSLQSRFCALRAIVPDLTRDARGYVQAILDVLDEHPARMIMPGGDGTIQALRLRRTEIEQRAALPLASEPALDIAVNKSRTLALATELGISVPRTVPLTDSCNVAAALHELGLPAGINPIETLGGKDGVRTQRPTRAVLTVD